MLAVCAPFGQGKTTTVMGAALERVDGMPQCVLFLAPGDTGDWCTNVKQFAGLSLGLKGFDRARHLLNAIGNNKVSSQLSKLLRLLDVDLVDRLMQQEDYGALVIEDYNPCSGSSGVVWMWAVRHDLCINDFL